MVTRREQREKNMDTEDGKDAEKPDAESKTPARAKRTKGANKQDQPVDKAPKRTRASKPKETEKDKETKEKDAAVEKAPKRGRASKPKETEKDKETKDIEKEEDAAEEKAPKRRRASKPKETEKDKETKDIEKEEDAAEEKAPKRRRASKPKETEKDKVDKAPKRRRASKPKETEKDNVDKAPTRRRASKLKETEKDKEIEKKNSEPEALENKTSKTWAGRWIPTEANALAKFNAISPCVRPVFVEKNPEPIFVPIPMVQAMLQCIQVQELGQGQLQTGRSHCSSRARGGEVHELGFRAHLGTFK